MCDAASMASMGMDLAGGIISGKEARSAGKFNAAMMDVQMMLADANSTEQKSALNREFSFMARKNLTSIAVSGLNQKSFAGVAKGNKQELKRGAVSIDRTLNAQMIGMTAQKAAGLADAKMQAATAMFSGISSAVYTGIQGELSYQKNRIDVGGTDAKPGTPETRFDYFKRGLG